MFRLIKKYFVPHKGNQHHPHILRTEAIIFLLAIMISAEGIFLASTLNIIPGASLFSAVLPNVLVQSANASRQESGLPVLTANALLEKAAALKAQDMATKGYFAHTSPEGITPWYWVQKAGYEYTIAGENLAVNFIDSSDVHTAWMNSPSHRANIVNAGYTEIGIATAKGMYQGNEAIFVVQYFGKPKSTSRIAVVPQQVHAATPMPTPQLSSVVIPALAKPAPVSSVLTTMVAEPRKTTQNIFLIIGGLVLFSLILMMLIRFEFPRPAHAIGPMLLFFFMLSAIALNRYIGLLHSAV